MPKVEIYALYIMGVSIVVLGAAFVALWRYDRKAQRAHDEWLSEMDRNRPTPRLWK